jgi:hypothetical protein
LTAACRVARTLLGVDVPNRASQAVAPAVAGLDENGGVAGLDLLDEFADHRLHIVEPEVVARGDREALFAQQVRVALRVGPRLLQGVDVLIRIVADDEREPVFREREPRKAKPAAPRPKRA